MKGRAVSNHLVSPQDCLEFCFCIRKGTLLFGIFIKSQTQEWHVEVKYGDVLVTRFHSTDHRLASFSIEKLIDYIGIVASICDSSPGKAGGSQVQGQPNNYTLLNKLKICILACMLVTYKFGWHVLVKNLTKQLTLSKTSKYEDLETYRWVSGFQCPYATAL